MSKLWELFLKNNNRVIHKYHHYFPIYEKHFSKFVNQQLTFLEIGCGEGGSLNMWKEYFGPHVTIIGLDIREECKSFEDLQINVRIGDQSNPVFLQSVIDEFGPFDIILDDGSHVMSHIKASFNKLYPHVNKNGIYMIEDLHTAYWDEYEGGLKREGSFIELSKDLIDSLNWSHSRGTVPETPFAKTTMSMHFYDSIIAFEKGHNGEKTVTRTGFSEGSQMQYLNKKLEKIKLKSNLFKYVSNKIKGKKL